MKRWAVLLVALAASCGAPEPPAAPPKPVAAPTPAAPKAEAPRGVHAEMRTVDYAGKPMANMVPIATLGANAFDEPIVSGEPTDSTGVSVFTLPQNTHLFVRAWDPQMRFFANNFYEMPAMTGTRTEPMTITMVPAAAVEVVVQDAQGAPLANAAVEIMLNHQTRGPWWPSRGTADGTGSVRFSPVPPGEYVIDVSVAGSGAAQVPMTFLPPTRTTSLGAVRLR